MRHTYDTDHLPERVQLDAEALVIVELEIPADRKLAAARASDAAWRQSRVEELRQRLQRVDRLTTAITQFLTYLAVIAMVSSMFLVALPFQVKNSLPLIVLGFAVIFGLCLLPGITELIGKRIGRHIQTQARHNGVELD